MILYHIILVINSIVKEVLQNIFKIYKIYLKILDYLIL